MAIQSKILSSELSVRLIRHIRNLAKKGIVSSQNHAEIQAVFCMDIQIVPKKQVDAVSFGAPEGMRVFLGTAGMVVGALDYLYSGGRLTFSSAHTHDGVKSMVTALNALEKRYRAVKGLQSVQLIHFLLSPSPYIMVKNKNIRDFYYWPNGRTMKISKEKLKKQIKQILDSRPSYITTKP